MGPAQPRVHAYMRGDKGDAGPRAAPSLPVSAERYLQYSHTLYPAN